MSKESQNASNSINVMLVGTLMTDVLLKTTPKGTAYATFMLSGEGEASNYWVSTFNDHLIGKMKDNIGKLSVVSVTGELTGCNEGKNGYSPTINVNAKTIDFIANFGKERNSEGNKAANSSQGHWGEPQPKHDNNNHGQQQMAQGASQPAEPPMDFDDDIPF